MKNLYFLIAFCFIFFGYSFKSFAQKDSINYDSLAVMPLKDILKLKVTGVSKYEEVIEKSPASVFIITESQIRENCYQDLSDVLKNVVAIDIVDNARGFGEYYTFRGIEGNDRFLVLVDGQKINPASGTFLSVGNSISVKFAKQIEIIYGPSSVMYGADAFAGIINIVSKDAFDKLDVSANIDYGSMNTINGEIAAQFKVNKNFSFSAFARIYQSDGPNFIGRDTIFDIIKQYHYPQRNNFEQPIDDHTIFLKTKYKNFTLSYFRQQFNEGNALGMSTNNYIYNKENKWALCNNMVWATYKKKINKNGSIFFDIAYTNRTQDPETQFYKWNPNDVLESSFNQYMTGIDNTLRSSFSYNRTFFENKSLKIITGIEYEYTNSIPPYANDQLFGSSDKFEGETAEIIKKELTIIEQRYAGFAQITYSPLKKLDFILGGRYDYSLRNKETFNPRMSFVYTPFKTTVVKLMYGTAFQAPSLFYQYEQWGSGTAVMLSTDEIAETEPNWKLENQKITTYEVAIYQKLNNNITFNLSLYHSSLTNLIERNIYTNSAYNKYFSTSQTSVYSTGIRNENIGTQYVSGINFKTEINLKKDFYSYLSYSYTNAYAKTEDGKTEDISRIAKHKFWLGFIYRNLFNNLNISSRLKWIGNINNRNKTIYPSGTQQGYFNMDFSLRVKNLIKSTVFYVRLENILNSEYSHGSLLDQVVYTPNIPQPGFVGRFGVEINLRKK